MNSSEAAEQMVKFSIEGIEMLLRVSGTGAERIAVMLYTMSKDKQMTKGKTSLNKMLKSGSPLQIFSVKASELKKFEKEAKKYGILYTALIDKNLPDNDGIVDIMVRSEDASKVNRVVERFKLAQTDNITIRNEIEKDKMEENDIPIPLTPANTDVTSFLAKQAVRATNLMPIRAIITDSFSGLTARNLAAFRGRYPVLAICYKEKTMRHLALSYGVEAIYMPEKANGQEYYFAALRKLMDDGVLSENEMVAYLSGGKQGTHTSFLEINQVGDVLKSGDDYVLPNRNRYL